MTTSRETHHRSGPRRALAGIAGIAAGLAVGAATAGPALAAPANCPSGKLCSLRPGATVPGCSSGDVCIYNGTTFGSGVELRFYRYANYNLHGQYHGHLIVNDQHYDSQYHESAVADLCTGYNGTRQLRDEIGEGDYTVEDLTPINSISLKAGAYPLGVPDCGQ